MTLGARNGVRAVRRTGKLDAWRCGAPLSFRLLCCCARHRAVQTRWDVAVWNTGFEACPGQARGTRTGGGCDHRRCFGGAQCHMLISKLPTFSALPNSLTSTCPAQFCDQGSTLPRSAGLQDGDSRAEAMREEIQELEAFLEAGSKMESSRMDTSA
jgi:hypothetical protein